MDVALREWVSGPVRFESTTTFASKRRANTSFPHRHIQKNGDLKSVAATAWKRRRHLLRLHGVGVKEFWTWGN